MRIVSLFLIASAISLSTLSQNSTAPFVVLLGVAQDGGYPHIGCQRACCKSAIDQPSRRRNVIAAAVVSPADKKWWLLEATPDITQQLQLFATLTQNQYPYLPEAVFVTHAHIGHYTGLMYFGREAMATQNLPVYVLPRMKTYLETNGPWSQLVNLHNVALKAMTFDSTVTLSNEIRILAIKVPHRDEYSETAGFSIQAGKKSYLFVPDIDKWGRFEKDIVTLVKEHDIAFLDASFNSNEELSYRNIKEVPHPLVTETVALFKKEPYSIRHKIVFIHFNHTNPLLQKGPVTQQLLADGFQIGHQGRRY